MRPGLRPHLLSTLLTLTYIPMILGQTSAARETAALPRFSQAAFRAHMAFLADDLLEGRGTATRGHDIAARYIAAQFELLGLKPAGEKGTYFQQVPLREVAIDQEHSRITVLEQGGQRDLRWGEDFIMRGSETQSDVSAEAPVVFVGYGVTAANGQYNDYEGTDVKGKIVALLNGAPPSLKSELRAHAASAAEKQMTARSHGAIGMVTLRPPEADSVLPWDRVVGNSVFPGMRWRTPDGVPADSFPEIRVTASLSQAASEALFRQAPKSWAEVLADAKASKRQAFPLNLSLRIREGSTLRDVTSPNVAAILPGSDPKLRDEYVVYTAHSDHLGIGKPINGDSIYNGAEDDASGVAALIEIARAFKNLERSPARSILFLAVTAEEKGMLGSDYYAHFPTVPIRSIVADLNMDGPSLFYTFKDIVALGGDNSTLGQVVQRSAQRMALVVTPDPEPEQLLFIRSDQYSFVRQGVPSLFINEGFAARDPKVDGKKIWDEWTATRYHAPSDDMSQPMNLAASVEYMQLHFLIGRDIAENPQRPAWNKGDFFGNTFGHH